MQVYFLYHVHACYVDFEYFKNCQKNIQKESQKNFPKELLVWPKGLPNILQLIIAVHNLGSTVY
jgi:hypothetical protein